MIIAVNHCSFITSDCNDLLYDYIISLAGSKPEHQFILIISSLDQKRSNSFENITYINSSPGANSTLMWKIWLDYTLPAIAKKQRANLLIHLSAVSSLRTQLPQLLFINDLSFLHSPSFFSKKQVQFLKKNMPAFMQKTKTIAVTAARFTDLIKAQWPAAEKKIMEFNLAPDALYHPVRWEEKEAIKEKYAEGKEYFLFIGEINPGYALINLLKAFSFFKQRQKSNMQLIIVSKTPAVDKTFVENLKTYKYRKDVHLLIAVPGPEMAKLSAAAYTFIYPALYEGCEMIVAQLMQCCVPVIASNNKTLQETSGNGALYFDPARFEDIAAKMMLLFKDEKERDELIDKGKLIMRNSNPGKTEEGLWEILATTAGIKQ